MVRALIRGERSGTAIQVLTFIAVLIIGAVSIYLVHDAKSTASRAVHAQQQMTQAFRNYQVAVYQRCLARAPYDQSTEFWRKQIENYYIDLRDNIKQNSDPKQKAFYDRLLLRVNSIIDAGSAAEVPDELQNCTKVKPTQTIRVSYAAR